ncbi:MAG: RluA family pseudouridine synthase [Brevundimonas sp.]|nr:MAG: RluA family pseudouridine synthase [Brevundimonas sp.]
MDAIDDEFELAEAAPVTRLTVRLEASSDRLDKALAAALPELSRARIQALLAEGAITLDGAPLSSGSARTAAGDYAVDIPAPRPADPQPQAIPLTVLYEDADLIVVDKPAGMAAHPAPGTPDGTLVNALLAHCGDSLSGVGGVLRPGIVHRLDKDTSGVMVAAKSDRAHAGLSALFATHDIERTYIALTRGMPLPRDGRVHTQIGRSSADRKKMAVLKTGGREAITDYRTEKVFGPQRHIRMTGRGLSPAYAAARVACTLQTGRTHQIRVHMASLGAPILGDPVYGTGGASIPVRTAIAEAGLTRQALHAAVLGFVHPVTGETLRFETAPPADMQSLEALLSAL